MTVTTFTLTGPVYDPVGRGIRNAKVRIRLVTGTAAVGSTGSYAVTSHTDAVIDSTGALTLLDGSPVVLATNDQIVNVPNTYYTVTVIGHQMVPWSCQTDASDAGATIVYGDQAHTPSTPEAPVATGAKGDPGAVGPTGPAPYVAPNTLANRPSPASVPVGTGYPATDDAGGSLTVSTGTSWPYVAPRVNDIGYRQLAYQELPSAFTVQWRGAWVSATSYALNDVVTRPTGSRTFVNIAATSGTTVPESDATHWLECTATGGPIISAFTCTVTPGALPLKFMLAGSTASAGGASSLTRAMAFRVYEDGVLLRGKASSAPPAAATSWADPSYVFPFVSTRPPGPHQYVVSMLPAQLASCASSLASDGGGLLAPFHIPPAYFEILG